MSPGNCIRYQKVISSYITSKQETFPLVYTINNSFGDGLLGQHSPHNVLHPVYTCDILHGLKVPSVHSFLLPLFFLQNQCLYA
jgi:hypothetical protein